MAATSEAAAAQIENLIKESGLEYRKGNLQAAVGKLLDAWSVLLEPAVEYKESYHIAGYLIRMYTALGDHESATKWADILQRCDLERHDDGHREFIAGKVAYGAGDVEKAKAYLKTSFKKCKGRFFEGEDPIYLQLAAAA